MQGVNTQSDAENLKLAEHCLRAGKLDDAERACRAILNQNPRSVEALVLLARTSHKAGNAEMAIQLYRKALKIDPSLEHALDELEALLYGSGRHQEAIEVWKAQMVHLPNDARAPRSLGMCYLALGRLAEAAECFTRALELEPDNAPLYQRLGIAYQSLGKLPEAAEAFRKAVSLEPREPNLHIALAQTLVNLGDNEGAMHAYSRASELEPDSVRGNIQLAQALMTSDRLEEAETQLKKVLSMDPTALAAHVLFGGLLLQLGKFEEAASALKEAIRLDPHHVPAYFFYTQSKKLTEDDRQLVKDLSREEQNPELALDDRRRLHYALGKAFDDLGEYESAMKHFIQANRYAAMMPGREGRRFSAGKYMEAFDFATEHFSKEFFERFEILGSLDELPLIVVGMMRSGTTLVEQILSSHPQIGAGGELKFWQDRSRILNSLAAPPHREKLAKVADEYHELLRSLGPGKKRVTDKMPQNFMYLGPVHMIFPKARIIHCRRNPLDNALSIYFTPMRETPDFAHNRENIVFMFRQYQRLMQHWREVLPPDRFMEIDYEELVADPEPIIRKMIEFVGLDWDDACLRHDKNERAVRTPSVWQARQKVYKTSVERWRNYEPWLGALKELQDLPSGA